MNTYWISGYSFVNTKLAGPKSGLAHNIERGPINWVGLGKLTKKEKQKKKEIRIVQWLCMIELGKTLN